MAGENTRKNTAVTLGDLISMHVEGIMADRTKMRAFELDIDEWVKKQDDRTQVKRNEVLSQLKTAQNVLESIYSRVAQSY